MDDSPRRRVREALRDLLRACPELACLATSPAVAGVAAGLAHLTPRARAAAVRAVLRLLLLRRGGERSGQAPAHRPS